MQPFEIKNTLSIQKDIRAGEKIVIHNDFAQAEIYLLGANLTHFQPKDEEKVIFDGKESYIIPSKSAHFGIPICWPWFGPHPTDKDKAQHGFARNKLWNIIETKTLSTGETLIALQLTEDKDTLSVFPHSFELTLTFTIGKTLTMSLTTHNTSNKQMSITQALHSYFYISHTDDIYIEGLENISYLDQLDKHTKKNSSGSIDTKEALDRIYINTDEICTINDPLLKRKIIIEKEHSHTTVVWNPGENNSLHDIGNKKYHQFVCIETANVREDTVILHPKASYSIKQMINCERLDK
ncbi:MAG: D-hexose-6-phosphate mutarotase [Sulfurovum sp.]|nr:D-hexose-6-phosphate mutarotase [Sulfurovum sp.]